ncbi:hypothetical protein HYR99_40385 [Candidatus Poribacteria bacterium]|nr:hypothetical protein [Candidatus Poribacteria bacterium]
MSLEALKAGEALKSGTADDVQTILSALSCLDDWVDDPPVISTQVDGAPPWYRHEYKVWELGESLRALLLKKKKFRQNKELFDRVAEICQGAKYGKGRQIFVLVLGAYGGANYAPIAADLLDDAEVAGHAVDALLKMRGSGYAHLVDLLEKHPIAWIRNEAKKYCERYPEAVDECSSSTRIQEDMNKDRKEVEGEIYGSRN